MSEAQEAILATVLIVFSAACFLILDWGFESIASRKYQTFPDYLTHTIYGAPND